MARDPATSVNEAALGAGTAGAAGSHAHPSGRTKLMAKVTQSRGGQHATAGHARDAAPAASPRLIEEAARIFLALGITAADLRLRAKPGSALRELADAMETPAGAR
jgi:hypothetical protein